MKKAGGGKIINIGSMASYMGGPRWTAYGPTKAGIVQLSKNCASAWAKDNIQVNTIWPGMIETEFTKGLRANQELLARVIARTAAGRMGTPDILRALLRSSAAPPRTSSPEPTSRWTAGYCGVHSAIECELS
jgi:2-deoxy-D-gluconate 3-dehydrogenase